MSLKLKIVISLLVLFWVFPFIVSLVMSIPATNVLIKMEDTTTADLTIKVTGHQWRWHYEYLDNDVDFFSVSNDTHKEIEKIGLQDETPLIQTSAVEVHNALIVPSGREVRILVTSNDVIHAWRVPAFGVKKDAIPGYVNELWFNVHEGKEGIYQGQCAEVCGNAHAYMQTVVKVVTADEFNAWLVSGGDLKEVRWIRPTSPEGDI